LKRWLKKLWRRVYLKFMQTSFGNTLKVLGEVRHENCRI
jgi:hypothetical protein